MRYFWVIDGRRLKTAKPCGLLSFDEQTRTWGLQIAPEVGPEDVPMLFVPFIERGERDIPPSWALEWVQERIPPPTRQNIGEILAAHGLEDYDELTLLLSAEGRCSQDEFMIEEVAPLSVSPQRSVYEYAVVKLPTLTASNLKSMVGESIKKSRTNLGISQDELARRSGVPHATICRIERGQANPTLETLADILDGLQAAPMFKLF